ncbi:hypothetical protein KAW18_08600 [candidate division WOR-3 bacterium]|nr:hypothetical protein [candidate division WOR-3 bacterium]
MKYPLLKDCDKKAIDAIKESYGGAKNISQTIKEMRDYEKRKNILSEKGFGEMIQKAEELVTKFPKLKSFTDKEDISYNDALGTVTTQVSGFQGQDVTFRFMHRVSESDVPVFIPAEMISVMTLREEYVYDGGLLATLAMTENLMGVDKFCNTNFVSTPLPEKRFNAIEDATKVKIPTIPAENGLRQIQLINQGTPFGNLGGVEVSNNNYLIYIDGVIKAALATGSDFFLNPSWSTITGACYFGRDIPNIHFKISMLLATQNPIQFRMLLNIMQEYSREDGTSPIYEINLGNAVRPEIFVQCSKELTTSDIENVSLSAHIRINPDLGIENFNWFDNAAYVVKNGENITIKYESDGEKREMDTMGAYFLSPEELKENAETIGDVVYYKAIRCTRDAKELMKMGARARFARCVHGENE